MSLGLRVAGFLTAVAMDMHAAGRMAINRGRGGVIKHGTPRTATAGAVFFAFDVVASCQLLGSDAIEGLATQTQTSPKNKPTQ
jgi:hypothetical protein